MKAWRPKSQEKVRKRTEPLALKRIIKMGSLSSFSRITSIWGILRLSVRSSTYIALTMAFSISFRCFYLRHPRSYRVEARLFRRRFLAYQQALGLDQFLLDFCLGTWDIDVSPLREVDSEEAQLAP